MTIAIAMNKGLSLRKALSSVGSSQGAWYYKPAGRRRRSDAGRLRDIWCGVDDRWCYLFNVLDIFSREWIAYSFNTNAGKENAILAVVKAAEKHPEASGKVRLWSDNGPQYISDAFSESMKALRLEHKFIAYHKPEDDPYIESFHGKFKREYVWPRDFQTFQEAEQAIAEAFVDYNQNRPHSALGYLSPYEFLSRMGVIHK